MTRMNDTDPTPREYYSARREQRTRARRLRRARNVSMASVAILVMALAGFGFVFFAGGRPPAQDGAEVAPVPVASTERVYTRAGAQAAGVIPSGPATITIAAVGDMIFDRQVAELIAVAGGRAPLDGVSSILAEADVAIGNLESPLADGGTAQSGKDVVFRGDPRGIEGLKASGFDVVTLANNHALDYGSQALEETLESLDEARITHAGAGMDDAAAWAPAVIEIDPDTSLAYFGFSHILPPGFVAGDTRPGVAAARLDMERMHEAVAGAQEKHDYVIVSYHWGIEYQDDANGDQVRDARATIDAGADMVLSHHPHVIQGVEVYKDGLIAYSLGDFVFDHYSRKTGEAFILEARIGGAGITDVTFTPVYLDGHGAPDVVTGSEADAILDRLELISSRHGTAIAREGDRARLVQ